VVTTPTAGHRTSLKNGENENWVCCQCRALDRQLIQ